MVEYAQRYAVAASLAILAGGLVYVGESGWALMPAIASVYLLGRLLQDVWRDR